ncbi:hypothetical protein [Gallaecimonas pentaromativorans]|uniref:hypothetical protein n=1 Tax=Gallaecimonas pentaromativorans TaxID=584787 RepID=UPI003A91375C
MSYSDIELKRAYQELIDKENIMAAFLGGIGGAIPGAAIFYLIGLMHGFLLIMLVIPPALIGISARFTGYPYHFKTRLPLGLLAAALHIAGCWYLQLSPLFYLVAAVAFVEAVSFSKITPTREQEAALTNLSIGRLKLDK